MLPFFQLHAVSLSGGRVYSYDLKDWDYLQSQADNLLDEIWLIELREPGVKGVEEDRVLLWSREI